MATSKERKFWLEFFELYKSKPELWKIRCEEYKDRAKKSVAYNVLVEKCKEIEPLADRDFVTKKINSFRSVYRRELKKVIYSLKSGVGSDEVYVPSLWYYKCLSFLRDQEDIFEVESSTIESSFGKDSENEDNEMEIEKAPSARKKEKQKPVDSDELLEFATKRLKQSDVFSQNLANVWASEFKLVSDEQKLFAKKAIDDILFEARMGTLHRNSVKINQTTVIRPENSQTVYSSSSCMPNQNDYSQYYRIHIPDDAQSPVSTMKIETSNETLSSPSIFPMPQQGTIGIENILFEPQNDQPSVINAAVSTRISRLKRSTADSH